MNQTWHRPSGRTASAAVIACAVLAVAGCGSSSGGSSSRKNASASAGSAGSGSITAGNASSTSDPGIGSPTGAGGLTPSTIPSLAQLKRGSAPKLPTSGKPLAGKTIAVLSAPPLIPYGRLANPTITKDFERLGAKVKLQVYSSQANPTQQAQQLQAALTQHPSGIVLEPLDQKGLTPLLIRAKAEKIPVVFMGPALDPALYAQHLVATTVAGPNYAEAVWGAKNMVQALRAEGRKSGNILLLMGSTADGSSPAYIAGFEQQLAKTPQYKIAGVAYTNYDPTTAAQVAGPWLAKYTNKGGIAGMFSIAGNLLLGGAQAAKQANMKIGVAKKGLVLVAAACTSPQDWKATETGEIWSQGTHWPPYDANAAAAAMVSALQGKHLPEQIASQYSILHQKTAAKYQAICTA